MILQFWKILRKQVFQNFYHLDITFNIKDLPIEKYLIDKSYNFAYDKEFFSNGRLIVLKDKLKNLSESELKQKIIEFEEKYRPTSEMIDIWFESEIEHLNSDEFENFKHY